MHAVKVGLIMHSNNTYMYTLVPYTHTKKLLAFYVIIIIYPVKVLHYMCNFKGMIVPLQSLQEEATQ